MKYADLETIRGDEPTPTVLALCDAVEWMRDRLIELDDKPSLERFHVLAPDLPEGTP
jgi:hypothetical protein